MTTLNSNHHAHISGPFKILKKERLTPSTNRFLIEAPFVARAARPGQFVIVRVIEDGERIPITIADADSTAGTITVVVQEVGRTSRIFGLLGENENVLDLVGPLGEPFKLRGTRFIGVGGGFGSAALLPIVRMLKDMNTPAEVIIGARNRDLLILENELSEVSSHMMPCTDDGSYGFKGFVTERLRLRFAELKDLSGVEVVAIGPMPMMRAVAAVTAEYNVPTQVSLDPIMIDGTGMCGGCRVTVAGEVKFACVDGPLFDAVGIDFDECVRRGKTYKTEEAAYNAA
jgi:ferredoxin--NADP+ reductase